MNRFPIVNLAMYIAANDITVEEFARYMETVREVDANESNKYWIMKEVAMQSMIRARCPAVKEPKFKKEIGRYGDC